MQILVTAVSLFTSGEITKCTLISIDTSFQRAKFVNEATNYGIERRSFALITSIPATYFYIINYFFDSFDTNSAMDSNNLTYIYIPPNFVKRL